MCCHAGGPQLLGPDKSMSPTRLGGKERMHIVGSNAHPLTAWSWCVCFEGADIILRGRRNSQGNAIVDILFGVLVTQVYPIAEMQLYT